MARRLLATLLLAVAVGFSAAAQDAIPERSPEEVKALWQNRLNERHFIAKVRMQMDLGGLHEERELAVYRDDEDGTRERLMVRFEAPPDLRRVAILYLEHPDRPNDYFVYQPATRRVRRLPSSIADDDVYGVDLEFLGFGVAEGEPTRIEEMKLEELKGRPAYRLEESAREINPRFDRRITWVDAEHFIPVKTEHFLKGKRVLVAETGKITTIQGVLTPTEMVFDKPVDGKKIRFHVESIDYERTIPDEYFSTLNLIRSRTAR